MDEDKSSPGDCGDEESDSSKTEDKSIGAANSQEERSERIDKGSISSQHQTDNTSNGASSLSKPNDQKNGEANNVESSSTPGKQPTKQRAAGPSPEFKGLCNIIFHYLYNTESARIFLHRNLPSNIRTIQENPIVDAERYFGECSKSFQATIDVMEKSDMRVLETLLSNAWLNYQLDDEKLAWLEIRQQDKRFYRIKAMSSTTSIENINVKGGSMFNPSTFINHWSLTGSSVNVTFEHDKELLTISQGPLFSPVKKVLEVPYESIIETVLVSRESGSWRFFLCLKHIPFIYKRVTTVTRKGVARMEESRLVSIEGAEKSVLSKTSTICITILDEKSNHNSNESDRNSIWNILMRLKWRGFCLSYVRVTEVKSSDENHCQNLNFEDFEIMYLWRCFLSCGYKVTDQMDEETVSFLKTNEKKVHPDLFANLISKAESNPFYDFKRAIEDGIQTRNYPHYSVETEKEELPSNYSMVRRLVVTPTAEIFLRREPTIRNRIIRQYNDDYFIRVVFRDEDFSRLSATLPDNLNPVVERYRQFMNEGFTIGNRRYEFLACSNSQLREHGVWFFSAYSNITAEDIRQQAGDLSRIRCIASYVSRLGLCFSASKDTIDVTVEEGTVQFEDDVEENGYCFTDGIGKISCKLAKKVANELEMDPVPSAFQIRYGGCKGVLSQDPTLSETDMIVIRKSMNKFDSPSNNLEILQTTKPGQLYLNRQIITLMTGLGVPDHMFLELQEKMLFSMADIMLYDEKALVALSEVSVGVKYKALKKSGFIVTREPFFKSILMTLYKSKLGELIRKSRIEIPFNKGRIMMGVVDETASLKYGQVFVSYSTRHLLSQNEAVVHTGTVVVAKNPCFHPGDLRKLQAVDIPSLSHMVDCIVFPQTGKRPHPNEMSGSDLDGDMYFVCWDENLMPKRENQRPMEFPSAAKDELYRPVNVKDVTDFISNYIKHDQLGVIANAHVVHADTKDIFCSECIELSGMHSDAVDFPKTGKSPKMTKDLRVDEYPDFMSKRDKPTYHSKKVLGKLFRQCRSLEQAQLNSERVTIASTPILIDRDLVYPGYEFFLEMAYVSHKSYSGKIFQLMTLYGIETETEVVTGVIRKLIKKRGYLQNERFEIGQIIKAKMSVLRKKTREDFFEEFGGESKVFEAEEISNMVLAKASAWYQTAYSSAENNGVSDKRVLSFPWIVGDILARIKLIKQEINKDEITKGVLNQHHTNSVLSQIGTSLLRHFDATIDERHETFVFLQEIATEISQTLRINVCCLGMLPLNLINPDERDIDLLVKDHIPIEDIGKYFISNLPGSIRAKGHIVYLKNGEDIRINFFSSHNVCDAERTLYALHQMANNPVYSLIVYFLLTWGRDKKLVGRSRCIFGELTFVTLILELVNRCVDQENISSPLTSDMKFSNDLNTLQWLPIKRFSQEETMKAANILLSVLRSFSSILKPDEKGGISIPFQDPSDPLKKRKLIGRQFKLADAKKILDQVLYAYQDIIKHNSVDRFFDHAVLEDGHMTYNLPLDVWGSIMFAESYTEKRLSESTGALISIRRTKFRDIPGLILEARGTPDQLWNVQQSLNELGERSSQFVTTLARDKTFILGAYRCLFEGTRSKGQKVVLKTYDGKCQPHHDGKILKIPFIEKCLDMSCDSEMFTELFQQQMAVVKNDYDPTYHGVLKLALTFGVFYLINAEDHESMTLEELDTELHDKIGSEKKRSELHVPGRWRGRGRGRGRGRRNYSSIMPRHKKHIRSCFMPRECGQQQVQEFLESSNFTFKAKNSKYHVTFKCGSPDYGKRHEGIVVLDHELHFLEFRLSDLKWLAADVSRGYSGVEKLLDVRCKMVSWRTLDIESVQQIDDVKALLEPETVLLIKYGKKDLYVVPQYHDRVTFIRHKEIQFYEYDGPESDESIWHDMEIEVTAVTEYSRLDSSGRFLDIITRNEVTVKPKFPAVDRDIDDHILQVFAEKVWKLIGKFGKQFDQLY